MEATGVNVSTTIRYNTCLFVVAVVMRQWRVSVARYALRSAPTKGQRATLPPDEPIRTFRMVIWFHRSKEMEVSG